MTQRELAAVVGGSSGIGAATARELAGRYDLLLVARRHRELQVLATELGGSFVSIDVTDPEEVDRLGDLVRTDARPLGLVVYAAGVLHPGPVRDIEVDVWDRVLAVNLRGAFLIARALTTGMQAGSRLVFVSSVSAEQGRPGLASYAASKAGLERMAEALAAELEPAGVTVHVVAPGPTSTPMLHVHGAPRDQLDPARVAEVIGWLAGLPRDVDIGKITVRPVRIGIAPRRNTS